MMLLTGCINVGKSKLLSNDKKLCKSIYPNIEEYQNSKISYDQFLEAIKGNYDNYCSDNTSAICISIKGMYSSNDLNLELEDCSQYDENDSLGKTQKDLCESSNKAKETMVNKKEDVHDAYISNLKRACDIIEE